MRNTKRAVSLVVLVTFLIYSVMASFALQASDKESWPEWAKDQIETWVDKGLISGYSDGSFKPNNSVSRAEFVTLVTKVFNFTEESDESFVDVPDGSWYESAVLKAYKAGIIQGYEGNMFKPNGYITREEAAAMVVRAYELTGESDKELDFSDSDMISDWAAEYVSILKENGYVSGTGDNKFEPKSKITRAQTVVMLNNVMGMLVSGEEYSKDISGNLVINKANSVLKDMKITGDVYITEGVGDGEVTFDGVEIAGNVIIKGGGDGSGTKAYGDIANCLIFANTRVLGSISLNKLSGAAKVVAVGSSELNKVRAFTTVLLEETQLTSGKGFGAVEIPKEAKNPKIELDGDFDSIDLDSEGSELNVKAGTIEDFKVSENAKDAKVDMLGGVVKKIEMLAKATLDLTSGYVGDLQVGEKAQDAKVQVKGAKVEKLLVKAKTELNITSGTLNNLDVDEKAKDCNIKVDGGEVNAVDMKSAANLTINKGTVKTITASKTTVAPVINIAKEAVVQFVEAQAPISIKGAGKVTNAKISAANVVIEVITEVYQVIGDIVAKIQDKEIDKDNDSGQDLEKPSVTELETPTTTATATPSETTSETTTPTATATATATATTSSSSGTGSTTTSTPVVSTAAITSAKYVVNGSEGNASNTSSVVTVDLSGKALTDKISEIKIYSTGTKIVTSSIKAADGTSYPLVETLSDLDNITVASILGTNNTDVTIGNISKVFGNQVTIYGVLSASGYNSRNVEIVITLLSTTADYDNDYATFERDGNTLTATIKSGKETTKVETISIRELLSNLFGELPEYIKVDGTYVKVESANYTAIKTYIAKLPNPDKTWSTLTLGDLKGSDIMTKKANDSIEYTLKIAN
jgi:hypothetical protein